MFKKPKLRKIVVAICALALLMGGVVYASTYFSVHDGPTWDDGNNIYRTGVCSDTAYGETACTQYTTDGTDLSYSGNNPSTWNGTKLSCSWRTMIPHVLTQVRPMRIGAVISLKQQVRPSNIAFMLSIRLPVATARIMALSTTVRGQVRVPSTPVPPPSPSAH